jgi:hypothetical protein
VVTPCLLNVGFDSATDRTIIVETLAAAMDLEGLCIHKPPLYQVFQQILVLGESLYYTYSTYLLIWDSINYSIEIIYINILRCKRITKYTQPIY